MTTISIALTTFNGERFLLQQLESLARQTRRPDELVVVDDGSSDASLAILDRFSVDAPFPVRIHRNEARLGWRGNFMKAAGLCRSELISFCDQDDVWYEDKLKVMSDLFDDPNTLLAYHDADLINQDGDVVGHLRSQERDHATLLPRTRPTFWSNPLGLTIIFRQTLMIFEPYWRNSIDPRDTNMPAAHDQWFYYLATNLGCVRFSPERLLGYRQHGANTVGYSTTKQPSRRETFWTTSQDAYLSMMTAFCSALEQAHADRVCGFESAIGEALKVNTTLLQRLQLNRLAHRDTSILRRARHFGKLLQQNAFSKQTEWSLGYTACLKALVIGVPTGR